MSTYVTTRSSVRPAEPRLALLARTYSPCRRLCSARRGARRWSTWPPRAAPGSGMARRRAQVLEPAQRVVVVAGREREQREGRIDQLAARQPAQHPAFEEVSLSALERRGDLGRTAVSALVLEKPLEDVDRRVE